MPAHQPTAPVTIRPEFIRTLFTIGADGQPLPDEALRAIELALSNARVQARKIAEARDAISADPTLTSGAAELKVRNAALRLGEQAAAALDHAKDVAGQILKRLETITTPAPPVDALRVGRILDRLSTMTPEQRQKEIAAAVQEGRGHVVGSVLHYDDFESGIGARERSLATMGWRERHHPQEADRMRRIAQALEALDLGGAGLQQFITEIASSPLAQKAAAQQARSQAAQADLSQTAAG